MKISRRTWLGAVGAIVGLVATRSAVEFKKTKKQLKHNTVEKIALDDLVLDSYMNIRNHAYEFDDLLRNDMRKHGLAIPILVDVNYQVINGFRRFQAAKQLGWTGIMCHIIDLDQMRVHCNLISRKNGVIKRIYS